MKSFVGKVAAITGASSGIGRALAVELAKESCALALSDVNEAGLAETAALARALGVKVTTARVDVADRAAVHAWADDVVHEHGKVNLVFNNAGVALGASIEAVRYEDFEWIMGIDFWGVVHGTKAFLPHLKASGEGHVVNVSSVFGLFSMPTQGTYNAAKFAVRGMTEALRVELKLSGAPVSATCVHPGGIKTNIARAARFDDSAAALSGLSIEQSQANFDKVAATTPEKAAKTILKAVRKDARRVLVGADAHVMDAIQRLLPTGYQFLIEKFQKRITP